MAVQYGRKISLVVYPPPNATIASETGEIFELGNQGVDLSALRIRFETRQSDVETPNTAIIKVWNLATATVRRLQTLASPLTSERARIVLQAGYEDIDTFGVIFDGQVKQVRVGRDNAVDTYVEFYCSDGDQAYNFGVINKTLAAGSTVTNRLDEVERVFNQYGVQSGFRPDLPTVGLPRGKVLYGLARAVARQEADNVLTRWSILNGQFQLISTTSFAPDVAVVLTSNTGLIGLPEQTQDGIQARALLNATLKVGRRVTIDNASVQQFVNNLAYTAVNYPPTVAIDGFYRVMVAEHSGDTRENDWYTDLICLVIDPSAPSANSVKKAG